jgi:hypothetical protein
MISRRRLLYSMAATPVALHISAWPLSAVLPATRHALTLLTTNQVQYLSGCGATGTSPCDLHHQSYINFVIREGI